MKIFLDTNVLVSALTTRGLCWDLLNVATADPICELLVSEAVITEFTRTLTVKFGAPLEKARQAAAGIRQLAAVVPESAALALSIPDRDDAPILASALAAGADFFVTDDKALLELGAVERLVIVSPRECWLKLRGAG
jgi:putative PIN family toxin of toxin-antitoxin system